MDRRLPAWAFALIYTAISMATEIVPIVIFTLRIPAHNAIIAPIILTIPRFSRRAYRQSSAWHALLPDARSRNHRS